MRTTYQLTRRFEYLLEVDAGGDFEALAELISGAVDGMDITVEDYIELCGALEGQFSMSGAAAREMQRGID